MFVGTINIVGTTPELLEARQARQANYEERESLLRQRANRHGTAQHKKDCPDTVLEGHSATFRSTLHPLLHQAKAHKHSIADSRFLLHNFGD